tara:strand:- start:588 stop:1814 length:1227 start_codon:yes stop_codon:yes gene_type:complete
MHQYKNFLTPIECQELIQMIDANHTRSSVVEGGTDRTAISNYRTSSTCNLNTSNDTVNNIHKRIAGLLNLDIKKGEAMQGQLYEVGQYFKPHNDFFAGDAYQKHCLASGNRTHTFMIYLNDGFKGGGTNFPNQNMVVVPETGKAVTWENIKDGKVLEEYMHEGVALEEGKKYIITAWWRENDWDGAGDEKLYQDSLQPKVIDSPTIKTFTHKDQIPKFTKNGFEVIKCPQPTWNIIKDAYEILKDKVTPENFPGKENVIQGGGSELLSFDNVPSIRTLIHEQLLPVHRNWIANEMHDAMKDPLIEPSFVYGIRSYNRGATLSSHVDRVETHHISSIIIVDKDLACGCQNKPEADDWPLDVQGHDGEWYKIYAEPGDMIMYESAVCEHARFEPFGGTFFRNFYVHYKLI